MGDKPLKKRIVARSLYKNLYKPACSIRKLLIRN